MAVFRDRGKSCQAIVRKKKDGVMIFEEVRTFTSRKLAMDWASRLEATIKLHGVPQRILSTQTLGDLLLKYKDAVNDVKTMRRQAQWELDQLAEQFHGVKLASVTAETFTKFATQRRKDGTGPATILHNLATVRAVLNAAKPMFGIAVDGAAVGEAIVALKRIGTVSNSQSRTRRPTDAELLALRNEFKRIAAHPSTIIPMATIIDLAVELPRRREELMSMLWEDYNGVQITLRDTKNPTAPRTEIVPVPPAAAAIIDGLPKIDARILPYNAESVSAAFERACARLAIKDLHLHDLRHEGITRLFAQGLDIQDVALISGHKSWSVLRRYTHITPAEVLEKLSARRKKTQEAAN